MDWLKPTLDIERDTENDCWILVDNNSELSADRRVVAAFFEDGPEPPAILKWIGDQMKSKQAA